MYTYKKYEITGAHNVRDLGGYKTETIKLQKPDGLYEVTVYIEYIKQV